VEHLMSHNMETTSCTSSLCHWWHSLAKKIKVAILWAKEEANLQLSLVVSIYLRL